MRGRVCAITGASSGLGYETALALAKNEATVLVLCRSTERGADARRRIADRTGHDDLHVIACDNANLDTVRAAAAEIADRFDRLDVLVHNAGLMLMQRQITVDGLEHTFQVNHLSAFLLTALLREQIEHAKGRVVVVSSLAHNGARLDFEDLQLERHYSGWDAYARSKLANVLFAYELARRLEGTGVTANALHPGLVRTGFARNNGLGMRALMTVMQLPPLAVSPRRGARTQVHLAASPEVEGVSGRYFAGCRERRSSAASYDEQAQRALWEASEKLVRGAY